jgi:hypothetical protein
VATKKEIFEITCNTELFGALLELETTKIIVEYNIKELTEQLKDSKKSLRVINKKFGDGVVIYEKNHGKFKLTKR